MHIIYCSISVHGTHRFIQFALLRMLASLLNALNDTVHSPIFASFYFHSGSEFSFGAAIFFFSLPKIFKLRALVKAIYLLFRPSHSALWSACSSKWWKINFDDDFSCGGITNALHSINFRTEKEMRWKKLVSAGIWMLVKNVGHISSLSTRTNDQMRLFSNTIFKAGFIYISAAQYFVRSANFTRIPWHAIHFQNAR